MYRRDALRDVVHRDGSAGLSRFVIVSQDD